MIALTLVSFYWLVNNLSRPMNPTSDLWRQPRINQYFTRLARLQPLDEQMTTAIMTANCHQVGLDVGEDAWEYPLWVLFREANYPVTMRHIQVKNQSRVLIPQGFTPCAVISEFAEKQYGPEVASQRVGWFTLHILQSTNP